MRKYLFAVLVLALVAVPLWASEINYSSVSATTTSTTVQINAGSLVVINDGAGIAYIRVFDPGTPPAAATSSNIKVAVGESFEFSDVGSVSIVSASTSTVRLIWR